MPAQSNEAGRVLPTIEQLEPLVRAKLRDLEATLRADVGLGRVTGDRYARVPLPVAIPLPVGCSLAA